MSRLTIVLVVALLSVVVGLLLDDGGLGIFSGPDRGDVVATPRGRNR